MRVVLGVVLGCHGTTVDAQAGRLGLPERGPQHAGLAKPGRARDEDRMAAPLGRLPDEVIGEFEHLVAPDEDGALDGTRHGH